MCMEQVSSYIEQFMGKMGLLERLVLRHSKQLNCQILCGDAKENGLFRVYMFTRTRSTDESHIC